MKNVLLVILLTIFSNPLAAQRIVDLSKYSEVYYDSVRATVVNTKEEQYVIKAFKLQADDKITIDGKLNEPDWENAEHGSNFFEKEPYPLLPVSDQTEFAILYDDKNLYVGVWCWDSEPDKIVKRLNPRGTSSPDNVQLFFDTYHDHRTGYKFTISPTGVQMDELRYDDFKRDTNWNSVWYSAGKTDERGWYIEVKVPFFNLRFRDITEQVWGFNILRHISKNDSKGQWKPHLPEWELNTRMSTLGHLVGIKGIKTGRQFEVRPYSTAGSADYAESQSETKIGYGVDVRYSPNTNLTADLTVNPDFAQVDADVLVINLTRFPTRFKDLRPFFTERTNIFNSPLELFYSRRIGAKGDIVGGAKVTGKFKGGVEFGALACMVGESPFSEFQTNFGDPEEANYGVIRMKKDLFGSSSIGFLACTKEQRNQYNHVFGIDGTFNLQQN